MVEIRMSRRLTLIGQGTETTAWPSTAFQKTIGDLRVAVVHDWLVTYGGAERVLAHILTLFPQADLFTLCDFFDGSQRLHLGGKRAKTSFIQKLPFARTKYRSYLPVMPMAVEQLDLSSYDLVISSSHAVAHGVLTTADQLHISYINNTMVYAWDLYHHYLNASGLHRGLKGMLAKAILHYIRMWDSSSANRVDRYIANSEYMARRLRKLYNREADVVYPPVDIDSFMLERNKEDYYVTVSRLVPFKRMDLLVEAFNRMPNKKLYILGDGPEMKKLKAAAGPNIVFTGFCDRATVNNYVKKARAFLFSSAEPFGIAVVEAQACGTPVIAFNKGAAGEIVADNQTGIFFNRQQPEAVIEAVSRFEAMSGQFDPDTIRDNARRFSINTFRRSLSHIIEQAVTDHFGIATVDHQRSLPNRLEKFSAVGV
jgi:glycosyltransferase involved in cell wall biosynthesis